MKNEAKELLELIEKRRAIEKRERELKDFFLKELGSRAISVIDGVSISIKRKTRRQLDKALLRQALGNLSDYETATTFVRIDVEKAS